MFTSSTFLYDSKPNRVRTGAEVTISHRAAGEWARIAKQDGEVVDVKKESITVKYADGTKAIFPLGRSFGTWSGVTLPHDTVTNFKVGSQFKKDHVIAYNKNYFSPDPYNENLVLSKRGIIGKVVLWEEDMTLEDAGVITSAFSRRLSTGDTKIRNVKVSHEEAIQLLKQVGDKVTSETILCNLRPPLAEYDNKYSNNTAANEALDVINTATPQAEYNGTIDRIEVLYTGDLETMSESLQELVTEYDAKLYRRNKALGKKFGSAEIDPSYRIDNVDVGENQVVLVYYITEVLGAGIGDKLVLGNQLKTIISDVIAVPHEADDGSIIDISFGRNSIDARIVNSMDLISTSNTLLERFEKDIIAAYES